MRTGIIFGVFDLLHLGHIVMLQEAKRQCDHLIVALRSYQSGMDTRGVSQTLVERYIKLEGCRYVDDIIPYETDQDVIDIVQTTPMDICFVGEIDAEHEFPGKDYCRLNGIDVLYSDQSHRFSSEALRSLVHQKEIAKSTLGKII